MDDHKTIEIDPEELRRAQNMWHNFTVAGKYAIIVTGIVLLGLTFAFVYN